MSYGLSIFQIDENFVSLSLQRKGTANFSNGKVNLIATANEIVVISGSNGDVGQYDLKNGNITLMSPNATYVNYMIFSSNTAKTSGYGIEVYNKSGQVVFSSNHKFLKPIDTIDVSVSRGNFNYPVPNGKKYGVILSFFSNEIWLRPKEHYYQFRSLNISSRNIVFNIAKYVFWQSSSPGLIDAYWKPDANTCPAIIVDITGY